MRYPIEGITDYGIFKLDLDGYIRSWNPGKTQTGGFSSEEVLGRHFSCLYSPEDIERGRPQEELRLATALGKFEDEVWLGGNEESRVWGCAIITPLRDGAGNLLGFSRILRDETERRVTEQRLRQSEDRFRTLVESMPGLVFATDPSGRTTFVNPRFLTYSGLTEKEVIGVVWMDLVHPQDQKSIFAGWTFSGAHLKAYEGEFRIRYQRQDWRWQLGRVVPLCDTSGLHVIEWLGTSLDIDDRKRANQQVEALVGQRTAQLTVAMEQTEHALAEKTVLLREVHHRVKNNLAVITGLLGMQANAISDVITAEALQESQRRIQSMALIHEHLYGTLELRGIDFAEYARQLTFELLTLYGLSDRVAIKLETDSVEFALDRAIPCGLILNELVSNAFKYAFPDGLSGNLTVGCQKQSTGNTLIWVEDDGVGLVDAVNWETSPSLGLKIVRILVHQLDGFITLTSQAGTRVQIELPIHMSQT